MGNSLQDQLLALGLAKEKPARNPAQKSGPAGGRRGTRQAGTKPGRSADVAAGQAKPGKGPSAESSRLESISPENISPENISLEQAYRIREQEEKTARQRERERKMEEERQRAAINKRIRQIIEAGRLNLPDASEPRYFMYRERIRKVYASAEQLAGLNDGSLGVVYLAGGYHILDAENTEAVRRISAEHVADLLAGGSDDDELWAAYESDQAAARAETADHGETPGAEN